MSSSASRDEKEWLRHELQGLADKIAATVTEELWRRMCTGELSSLNSYLNAKQVAAMTGVSEKSLEAMRSVRRGPPFYKIGARVRYKPEDVRRWVEAEGPVD